MKHIRCKTLGCEPLNGPYCIYCKTDLYDAEFVQYGWFDPAIRLYWIVLWWIKDRLPRKCEVCGKRYRHGFDKYTCSVACSDEWLPF